MPLKIRCRETILVDRAKSDADRLLEVMLDIRDMLHALVSGDYEGGVETVHLSCNGQVQSDEPPVLDTGRYPWK